MHCFNFEHKAQGIFLRWYKQRYSTHSSVTKICELMKEETWFSKLLNDDGNPNFEI